ncbi:MAG: NADPH:quinone reductase [Pseudomonadota bacterium]
MKTVWYERNGPAESVLQFGDKPVPIPNSGEVLVKLATSGVNPSDVKSRAGRPLAHDFIVPNSDGAGIIEAVGSGVNSDRIGNRVWIWNGQWQRQWGTSAEYIAVPEVQAVNMPDNLDFTVAACFGIPGLTAAHAINMLEESDAETVLVTGAASSVGHYVTQMAAQLGRRVVGTASTEKADTVLAAGAAQNIDYKNENVAEKLNALTDGKGVGAVIDMDFSSTSQLISTNAVANKASFFCYGSNDMGGLEVPFRDLLFKSISLNFFLVYELGPEQRAAAIDRLSASLNAGQLDTRISHILPLKEAAHAHQLVESGEARGNVVLEI